MLKLFVFPEYIFAEIKPIRKYESAQELLLKSTATRNLVELNDQLSILDLRLKSLLKSDKLIGM